MARQSWVLKRRPDGVYDLVERDQLSAWLEKYQPKSKSTMFCGKIKPVKRGSWVWRDGKLIERTAAVSRPRGLQIVKDIDPFLNIAVDNGYIGGRKQRRDMMRAHGLEEVGNEKPRPTPRDVANEKRKHQDTGLVNDIKRAARERGYDWL